MRSACIVFGLTFLLAADDIPLEEPSAELAIVDRAIQAHGGAKKLVQPKGKLWKGKGKMSMAGMNVDYTLDYLIGPPNKARMEIEMDMGGAKMKFAVGTDGQNAWEQMAGQITDMTNFRRDDFHHGFYVMNLCRLLPLKEKGVTLAAIGESKHGEQTLVGLKVTQPNQRDVSLYFDKKTSLLTKSVSKVHDELQNNKEIDQEVIFSGYRDKDGGKIFDKLTVNRDGQPYTVEEFTEQKILDSVDEKKFEKPVGGN